MMHRALHRIGSSPDVMGKVNKIRVTIDPRGCRNHPITINHCCNPNGRLLERNIGSKTISSSKQRGVFRLVKRSSWTMVITVYITLSNIYVFADRTTADLQYGSERKRATTVHLLINVKPYALSYTYKFIILFPLTEQWRRSE